MLKRISLIIGVFIVGMIGGIFSEQIVWPYFVEKPLFYQYELEQSPVYITEKKEVVIQESTALLESIENIQKTIVGIRTITEDGEVLEGSGLVVTSDGLIVTLADLVPRGSFFSFFIDDKKADYQILKRDLELNIALVKLEKDGLITAAFANMEKVKIGERVFLAGTEFIGGLPFLAVNEGIVKAVSDDSIKTNIIESKTLSGSPLFDIESQCLGLSIIGENGEANIIPISKIKSFIGM